MTLKLTLVSVLCISINSVFIFMDENFSKMFLNNCKSTIQTKFKKSRAQNQANLYL